MARRVFFSFHYERDIWRASIVRNSWLTHEDREEAGFWDASIWEEAKRKGDEAIKRLIRESLNGTSVTAVLIGAETSGRRWVRYEISESCKRGSGILGVYIHNIRDRNGRTDRQGDNQFGEIERDKYGSSVYFSQLFPTYDWVNDDGYNNFGNWIEKAARKAGL